MTPLKWLLTLGMAVLVAAGIANRSNAGDWSAIKIGTEGAYAPFNFHDAAGKQLSHDLVAGELVPLGALATVPIRTTVTVPLASGAAPELRKGERIELWVSTATCSSKAARNSRISGVWCSCIHCSRSVEDWFSSTARSAFPRTNRALKPAARAKASAGCGPQVRSPPKTIRSGCSRSSSTRTAASATAFP